MNFSKFIDHTLLTQEADLEDIKKLCREAFEFDFYSVIINPILVKTARQALLGTEIKIGAVAGFPLGANLTEIKLQEALKAVADGADEIDLVANISALAHNEFNRAEDEISVIRQALPYNTVLKVIIESNKLSVEQQKNAAQAVINGGAQMVKSGTGFFGPVTISQIETLKHAVGDQIEIKAAGGIKTLSFCHNLVKAGASRIGSSSSVSIIKEFNM